MGFVSGLAHNQVDKYAQQHQPEDPFYEYYTTEKGETKRRKRAPPAGLSPAETKAWKKIAKHAHRLDRGIRLGPLRFGYGAIVGFVPYLGTATNAGLTYYLVNKPAAKHFDLPSGIQSRVQLNLAIGAGVTMIPFVGDILMATYAPNTRNVHLVEKHLLARHPPTAAGTAPGTTTAPNMNTTTATTA